MFRRFRPGSDDSPAVHTDVHAALSHYFEWAQDGIASLLAIVVLVIMVQGIVKLFQLALLEGQPPSAVLPQIILLLIFVELFRTLLYYLREHRVAVGLMIEVAIVSILREVLVKAPVESWSNALAVAVLLFSLGALMVADRVTSSFALRAEQAQQNGHERGGEDRA
jgi:uncharacterized membrane protein (DUF373 family)